MGGGSLSTELRKVVQRLAKEGPFKFEPTQKRIRLLFNGAIVADTTEALYVWEHKFYPQYYLPMRAFTNVAGFDLKLSYGEAIKDAANRNIIGGVMELAVRRQATKDDSRSITDMILFAADLEGPAQMLNNHVKVPFDAIDQWFEEDTPIYVHPKDPYKRVDLVQSTRPVRVTIPVDGDDVILAESTSSVHLYETMLPVRYYLPYTSTSTIHLRPSSTSTQCPYKGIAEYEHVVIDGNQYDDLVWHYRAPTIECAAVSGMRCFYNEKVDIWLGDGQSWVKQPRPKTHMDKPDSRPPQ